MVYDGASPEAARGVPAVSRKENQMKFRATLVICALAFALFALPGSSFADNERHSKRQHNVVTIDAMQVRPKVLKVSKDQVVVWANYSQKTVQLSFPVAMADKFTCPIRPRFYKGGKGNLLSEPIRDLEFAMPCRIEPGNYPYEVLGLSSPGPMDMNPEAVVGFSAKGTLIVE